MSSSSSPVLELRLAVTVVDYEEAVAFYRDRLGLPEVESFSDESGSGVVLDAGRATLELLSPGHAAAVDEIEVGRRVAEAIRVALEVEDSAGMAERLVEAGAERLADPVITPWHHQNVRLEAPPGLQLTLFTVLSAP
jgi:lactoylglutathione lyase